MDGKKILVSFLVSFQMLILQITTTFIINAILIILKDQLEDFGTIALIFMIIFLLIFLALAFGILFVLYLGLRSIQHIYYDPKEMTMLKKATLYLIVPAAVYIFLFWVILREKEITTTIIAIIGAIAINAVFEKGFQKWQKPVLDKKPDTKN